MAYDYSKARKLEAKAEAALTRHRSKVFNDNGDAHTRAIRRIKSLMGKLWRERASSLAGERLTRMGY